MSTLRLIFSLRNSRGYVVGSGFANDDLKKLSPNAVALNLEGARVDDDGILGLPVLHALRCLDLDSTKVTDKCLVAVARFPELEELWLECTNITDAGLRELHSTRLKFVSVAYTGVTQEGVASLARAVPGIEVST